MYSPYAEDTVIKPNHVYIARDEQNSQANKYSIKVLKQAYEPSKTQTKYTNP